MESTVLRQARHRRHPSLSEVESESISDTGQNCWGQQLRPKASRWAGEVVGLAVWRCGNHSDCQLYPSVSDPDRGGSSLPSLLHPRSVSSTGLPRTDPAPHGSGACESPESTWSRWPGATASCFAVLTRLRSPGCHFISLPSLLQVRRPVRQRNLLQEEAVLCSPAPPTLPRFSPHPSLQLCLWIGSCFLQFQEGARVAACQC